MLLDKSRFTEMLIEENALAQSGFESWIFCHGMLFNSPAKWWGDHGRRDFPHEGIDFCLYEDGAHVIRRLNEKTRIPVMHDGVVRAMFKDYLGQAIIIDHDNSDRSPKRFVSVYAHTKPTPEVKVGRFVKQGDVIATIADTRHSKAKISPHLHLSLGLPSDNLAFPGFVWNIIRDANKINLLDPLAVIDWPHKALGAETPCCRKL